MYKTPVERKIVDDCLEQNNVDSLLNASIREIKKLVDDIEVSSGEKFVRMEMGVPGLKASEIGINAEIEALKSGVASVYPNIYGVGDLKDEISRFVKLFLDLDVSPNGCIPTVGAMQGAFAAMMTINRMHKNREGTLFIDPGFPVQKMQVKILGQDYMSFDVYNYRGKKLKEKLESYLKTGKVSSILYSNPNNPSWINFTEEELEIIGTLATKYDVIIIEDLAYFGMDFRVDVSKPGVPPFQPTVGKYTDNYLLLISSSKVFSYAGQRIGMMVVSNHIFNKKAPDLLRYYNSEKIGKALIFGSIYSLSSGTSHSAQYALLAMLRAMNNGEHNFIYEVKEYAEKAHIMKKLFLDNGFTLVYDKDMDKSIADGFYFTISYPGMDGESFMREMLYYGISAISLKSTNSDRTEGVRACVSLVPKTQFADLEKRLKMFHQDHPVI